MDSDVVTSATISRLLTTNSSYVIHSANMTHTMTDLYQYNYSEYSDFPIGPMDNSEMLAIIEQDLYAPNFDNLTICVLIVCYAVLILFGAVGNGLVVYVVIKNAHMRTPRNIFIINLAISDLTLCLFTQPMNLYRMFFKQWLPGGFMCKFVGMFQGTNVFVSTISITAIALDRFQVIVYPTKDSMRKFGAAAALISIWIISFFMSSPLLIFSIYEEEQIMANIDAYAYRCIEDIHLIEEKGAYSVASMIVQYVLPIAIVTIAHLRICNKLKYRMSSQNQPNQHQSHFQKKKNARQSARKRRTNILLSTIAVVFAFSWLPLNLFNILTEFQFTMYKAVNVNLAYVICHMMVLSSACTNPVLYGWLNENFRNEFIKVFSCNSCSSCVMKAFFTQHCTCSPCVEGVCSGTRVPVIIYTKDTDTCTQDINGTPSQYEGCSVSGLNSISEFQSHRSQVSL